LALELVEESKTILDTNVANALRQAIEYIGRAARERTGHAVAKALPATVVAGNEEIDGLRKLTELASQRKKNV
jgi:hypothetical protein